jgi:hypothetical protein
VDQNTVATRSVTTLNAGSSPLGPARTRTCNFKGLLEAGNGVGDEQQGQGSDD